MRFIISILILSIFSIGSGTRSNTSIITIDKGLYLVKYSEILEQPVMVSYKVICSHGNASRKGMDFFAEKGIHTSDNADYVGNVWDKGHMAPAASFNCSKDTLKKVFSYINCALQHQNLNRGQWRELESFERELSSTGKNVYVKIDINFRKDSEVLETGATVPYSFTKHLIVNGVPQCYSFLNAQGSLNFKEHQINCQSH